MIFSKEPIEQKKYLTRLVIAIPSVFFFIVTPLIVGPCILWCHDAAGLAVMLLYVIFAGFFSLAEVISIILLMRVSSPAVAIAPDGIQQSGGFGFVDYALLLIVVVAFIFDVFLIGANVWLVLSFPFFVILLARVVAKGKLILARYLFAFSSILMVAIFFHLVSTYLGLNEGIYDFVLFGFFHFAGCIFGVFLLYRWYKPLFRVTAD